MPDQRPALTTTDSLKVSPANRNSVHPIHEALRRDIMADRLTSNTELNQLRLAKSFGVSRGPIREALRMLQAEGLVEVERNQRWRVVAIDPRDVNAVYAQRLLLEVLGVHVTLPLGRLNLKRLRQHVDEMEQHVDDIDAYMPPHKQFHDLLISGLPGNTLAHVVQLRERSERYQRFYAGRVTSLRSDSLLEHKEILEAAEAGDIVATGQHLADHYASVAQRVLGTVAPEYDPETLNAALVMVHAEGQLHRP